MRKKLVGAAVAVLGVAALGLGGTYAGFSDTEESQIQSEAGTLDLTLSTAVGATTEPVTFANMQPGQKVQHFLRLTNDGSIPGEAAYSFSGATNVENGCLPVELEAGDTCDVPDDPGDLGEQLQLKFFVLPGADCSATGGTRVGPVSFPAEFDSDGFRPLNGVVLGEDETRCVRADIEFLDIPNEPDNNRAQGDSAQFRFDFRLEQA